MEFIKQNWITLLFLVVIIFAVFLRVYKFHDWLIFKPDQVRDAGMIIHSYEKGPGELPLLGPRAGGTLLRLGPIFYYFQYFSAFMFHDSQPPVLAYPNLLFSLLTIPLFYSFSQLYFSKNWSMILTGLFSLSFLGIEYSRFTWNPNSAPFFVLAFLYSLLKIFDPETVRYKTMWYTVAGASFAIASQLHFSSFIALPIIGLVFLIIHYKDLRRALRWKQVLVFLGVIFVFYIPVILSDILNNGDNVSRFIASLSDKSSHRALVKNISKDAYYFGKYFLRMLTGYFGGNTRWHMAAWIFIASSLFALGKLFQKETKQIRRNFLCLCSLLFGIYFLIYIPLAYNINKPRFFLPLLALPFLFMGFLGKYFLENFRSEKILLVGKIIFTAIAVVSLTGNVYGTLAWFKEMGDSKIKAVSSRDTVILKTKGDSVWWTWGHFQKISEYMENTCQNGNIYFMMSKHEKDYMHSIAYALENKKDTQAIHKMVRRVPFDWEGCYYYVSKPGDPTDKISRKMNGLFKEEERMNFGSASVLKFSFANPPENQGQTSTTKEEGDAGEEKTGRTPRRYWKDLSRYLKL